MTTVKMVKCPGRCGRLIRADWGHACPQEKHPPTARASVATGRIMKSIQVFEGFDWDEVAKIIDEALADADRARAKSSEK